MRKFLKPVFTGLAFLLFAWQLEAAAGAPWAVILHWNDMHSANLPYQPGKADYLVGGYANLAGYIDSLRNLYPHAIVLNAGDDFQGSPVSNLTRGLSQILILNKIRPSAFTIGNHEFDYGIANLRKALALANFPVLSSNLYDSTKNDLLVEPYLIGNNGMLNVAIIGAITNDMRTLALPKNLEGIGILDQFAEIRKYVAEVEPITDLIILLSHNGLEEDSLLANQLTGVDVIIGGHSHSYLRQPMRVNNILICQAGSNGRNLGMLKVFVNKEQKNITEFKYESIETRVGRVRPSGEVARIVDSLETSIAGEMETVIGQLITDWKRNSHGESNIGNWICDATRAYFKADMAFMNSGGIRKDLKAGPIRVRDLWEISPFDNTIEKVEVTGKQLRYMMQYRLDNPRDLLQVSGLAYEYGRQTNKIVKLTVNGKPIKDNNRYVFVTNNFVTGQFERFFGIAPTEVKIIPTGVVGRDILIAAVKDQKRIDSRVEKRIVEKR